MARKASPRPASRASASAGKAASQAASSHDDSAVVQPAPSRARTSRKKAVTASAEAVASTPTPSTKPKTARKPRAPVSAATSRRTASIKEPARASSPKKATPSRTRKKKADTAVDDLDQGFVPKAPPPSSVAARGRDSSVQGSDSPGGRFSSPPRPSAAEPTSRVFTATGNSPSASASLPPRMQCPTCDYLLPRIAKFCRRCGIRQTPADLPAAAAPTPPVAAATEGIPAAALQPGPAAPSAEPAPSALAAENTGRIHCPACDMRLPASARFCRGCGVLLLAGANTEVPPLLLHTLPDPDPALLAEPARFPEPFLREEPRGAHAADRAAASTPASTPASAPAEANAGTEPVVEASIPVEPSAEPAAPDTGTALADPAHEPQSNQGAAPSSEEHSPPSLDRPLSPTIVRACGACQETIPAFARFCLYCGHPQAGAHPPVSLHTERSAESLHAAPAPAPSAGLESPAAEAAPDESHRPDPSVAPSADVSADVAVETHPAVPEPSPTEPESLSLQESPLADDVLVRVNRARNDIDTIGQDLERLTRRSALANQPAARPRA